MRGRKWQQQQKKQQQQAQRQRQAGYYWQQQQKRQQAQQQTSQRWQQQRTPSEGAPDWELDRFHYEDWEDNGGVLGFFKTVIKLVVAGLILYFVLRAIF